MQIFKAIRMTIIFQKKLIISQFTAKIQFNMMMKTQIHLIIINISIPQKIIETF